MCWGYFNSNERLIKKYFKFLKQYGFRSKSYYGKGHDYDHFEMIYTNRKAHFVVKVSDDYGISVTVQRQYWGNDILYCDFFDKESRKKLRTDIESININDIEQQLKIYSEFLMKEME
ncbi:MAG: hypothetical protein K2N23_08460, partial [Clostridia bacterium]|nr:hypothetical protein [Clostridia bacterium]